MPEVPTERRHTPVWVGLCFYSALFPAFRLWMTMLLPWPDRLVQRDFTNLWMAGYLTLHDRVGEIFDVAAFRHATTAILGITFPNNYSYPPHALFVAVPFGALPYALAFALWDVLSLGAFCLAARRYVRNDLPWWVVVLSPAVLTCLLYGHYGILYGALWLWAFQGSGTAAGLMTIKPHLGLLVAVQTLKRRSTLLAAIGTTVILVAASVLFFGLGPWRAFFTTTFDYQVGLLQSSEWGRYTSMVGPIVAYGIVGQILFALAAIFLLTRHFDVFSAATATFLIVPYGYHYDLTVVCLGFALLLARNWDELTLWEKLVACLAYLSPGLVSGGAWIVPPVLLAGLYVQVTIGSRKKIEPLLQPIAGSSLPRRSREGPVSLE